MKQVSDDEIRDTIAEWMAAHDPQCTVSIIPNGDCRLITIRTHSNITLIGRAMRRLKDREAWGNMFDLVVVPEGE